MLTMKTVGRFNRRPANSPLFAAFLGGLALVGVWLPGPLQAADYWVGSSGPCTHASVGAAFAAALANGPTPDTIRIAGGSAHYPLTALVEVTNDDITVIGGYSTCGNPVPSVNRPVFDVTGAHDAFRVFGPSAGASGRLRLDTVSIAMDPGAGRPLKIEDNGAVELWYASLASGHAVDGGNVHLSGANSRLEVRFHSAIYGGTASPGDGGGIYCEAGGQIVLESGSGVGGNSAQQSGGGIYLDACDLTFTTWVEAAALLSYKEIGSLERAWSAWAQRARLLTLSEAGPSEELMQLAQGLKDHPEPRLSSLARLILEQGAPSP